MGYQKTPWSVAAEWERLEVLQVSTEHMTCGSLQLRLTMAHSLLVTECVTVLLISVMISTSVLYTFAEWLLTVARREQTLMPTAQLDLCYKHSSQCNIIKIYQVSTCCILNILQVFHFCSWCSMIQRFQFSGVSTLRFVDWVSDMTCSPSQACCNWRSAQLLRKFCRSAESLGRGLKLAS